MFAADGAAGAVTAEADAEPSHHDDFAEVATRLVTGESKPEPVAKEPAEAKVETKPAESEKGKPERPSIPDQVLSKKSAGEPEKKEPVKVESEIDKIADPNFHSPVKKAEWDAVKSKGKEFESKWRASEQKTADLEKRIAEAELKGKNTTELETKLAEMEKQNREYLGLVQKVNVELDPEFRKNYVEGRQKLINTARSLVEEGGGVPDEITTALNLKGKPRVDAIAAVVGDMPNFQQGRIGEIISKLTALDEEAEVRRGNPEKYLEDRQREDQQRDQQERTQRSKAAQVAFESARSKISTELRFLTKVDDPEFKDWNDRRDAIIQTGEQFFTTNTDMEAAARAAIMAQAAPHLESMLFEEREYSKGIEVELAAAKEELKKLYGTVPSLSGKVGSHGTQAVRDMDFATRAMHEMPT